MKIGGPQPTFRFLSKSADSVPRVELPILEGRGRAGGGAGGGCAPAVEKRGEGLEGPGPPEAGPPEAGMAAHPGAR